MSSPRLPRQSDIARVTGLSQATVSRVLSDDPAVRPKTKMLVHAACEELGYRISIGGRILAAGSKAIVGLSLSAKVMPTDRYISVMYQRIATLFEATGWGTVLLPAETFETRLGDIGAAILIGVARDDPRLPLCAERGIPTVAIGHPDGTVFSVAPDDAEGGRLAATHLSAHGRTSIVMLSATRSSNDPGLRKRRDAFVDAAHRMGAYVRVEEIEHSPTATLAGYRAVHRLTDRFDGLFCDTDEAALGALTALRDGHCSVGEQGDVSIVGFDDLPGFAEPAGLSTIAQDFNAIAVAATELRREGERGQPARHVATPVRLVARET